MAMEPGVNAEIGKSDDFTILHLSDVHFGVTDSRSEMYRITDALINAATTQDWIPDVVVFSGDLAFRGSDQELTTGQRWLASLLGTWADAKLFIVPGNHDVDRDQSKLSLRQAYNDAATYTSKRERIRSADMGHLKAFFDWHQALRAEFPGRIISDWEDPFGCCSVVDNGARALRFIGFNTAILSCDNSDENKLVQDIPTLNDLLHTHTDLSECIIAVGHHPMTWLAKWNADEIEKLLNQTYGAHIYMHGHTHIHTASGTSNSRGQKLTILQGGAAYQGSEWRQDFSFYRLMFDKREISSKTFAFDDSTGDWIQDNLVSRNFVASLPQAGRVTMPSGSAPIATAIVSPISISVEQSKRETELDARRAIDDANMVYERVQEFLKTSNIIGKPIYSLSGRVKGLPRIIEKIKDRRDKGDKAFSVNKVEDICGYRYITVYQSDIPYVIERLLSAVSVSSWGATATSPFFAGQTVQVTIHTSRPINDPISIVNGVRDVLTRWGGRHEVDMRSQETGYSSIHLVIQCVLRRSGREIIFPVEFQIRSWLEEFWGQLDHKLRYETNRGIIGSATWHRHLNVLKAQFDSVIQYVDLIKETAEATNASAPQEKVETAVAPSQMSLSTADRQLLLLRDLPIKVYEEIKSAFDLWRDANRSREFGGDPSRFRLAADAFAPFLDGMPAMVDDKALSERLAYIAAMERAYMLQATQDPGELNEARDIYLRRIKCHPNDVTALFRLGQVFMEQRHLDEAISRLSEATTSIENGEAEDLDDAKRRVYEFARLALAQAHFRHFESHKGQPPDRVGFIQEAIKFSKSVYDDGAQTTLGRRQALNDFVYYAWEEQNFLKGDLSKVSVSLELFKETVLALDQDLEPRDGEVTFRQLDTLARGRAAIGDFVAASAVAREVCLRLEIAADQRNQRNGGPPGIQGERFRGRWAAQITQQMMNEDERDALAYALELIEAAENYPG